ncbi:MAG: UDP-N-acetylglucosamine 1-carboxyvinyltransferase, partial [Oscillospiraceae bacterium]|nr:UDP-N-acetylglucosamine 1-carboxyvinyltransferase [Oscillospiraceae bacterium]
ISAPEVIKAPDPIATRPYPGFPTDAQPIVMAASLRAAGETVFVENIFENRYRHVPELMKMGASIKLGGRTAVVTGTNDLKPAEMTARDLRGGAALTVAALAAPGVSVIHGLEHIDRGYDGLEKALTELGGEVVRAY